VEKKIVSLLYNKEKASNAFFGTNVNKSGARGMDLPLYMCFRGMDLSLYMCARGVDLPPYMCVRGMDLSRLTFAVFMDGDLPNIFSAASFIGEQTIILH
jgi:hypothetical protein